MAGSFSPILPGSWLGVFGGGQLGRMFVHAAQRMGYHVAVLDAEAHCPAAQAADRHFRPGTGAEGSQLISEFAQLCSAITLEFENVPAEWVRIAELTTPVRPGAAFLAMSQDRVSEKTSLQQAGFPVTPFVPVTSAAEVSAAGNQLGWPLIVKTARSGYDGKGQMVMRSAADVAPQWPQLATDHAIAEQRIEFQAEVSMLCARSAAGEVVTYPLVENTHARHILDISRCPASPELVRLESRASEIAAGIATQFSVAGLFCVEFFVDRRGELMINEIAPRPHNSGHLTIEAFNVSQFEQQVRAVCNLPLAKPELLKPAAMANLLGDLWFRPQDQPAAEATLDTPRELCWERALAAPLAYVHLYGKTEARRARKMGHLTCLADSAEAAVAHARELRNAL
jgi:5-(carboxyamino)imidazole ribonucleotide synthase